MEDRTGNVKRQNLAKTCKTNGVCGEPYSPTLWRGTKHRKRLFLHFQWSKKVGLLSWFRVFLFYDPEMGVFEVGFSKWPGRNKRTGEWKKAFEVKWQTNQIVMVSVCWSILTVMVEIKKANSGLRLSGDALSFRFQCRLFVLLSTHHDV